MYNKKTLKVGQKVMLIKSSEMDFRPYGGINSEMKRLLGQEVTVEAAYSECFTIKEDGRLWSWDYRLISKDKPKKISKVYNGWEFEDVDFILPCNYSLEKVIENDKAVICFVEEVFTGKIIKTVAVCQEGDDFNLKTGVEICMYKTLRKIADSKLKKF